MDDLVLLILRIAGFAIGVFIVGATLVSAIRTFVLPRSAPDQITRTVFLVMRRLFDMRMRKSTTYEERDQIMALYAPFTLLVLPIVWLICIAMGYTCIFWSYHAQPLHDALLLSKSSLLTLGVAPVAGLMATSIVFGEATIGLLLTALLIAYLPTMYAAFSTREMLVTLLEVRAGSPPSAVTLFQRFHRLNNLEKLHDLWTDWEQWFAQIEETHTSLAALSFFRSQEPDRSWVTAAGAVLDAASLYNSTLDVPNDYQASLTIRAGYLALRSIADFFGIPYIEDPKPDDPISVFREEYDEACQALVDAGIPIKADRDQAWRDFCGWRVNYDTVLISLATLTMAPYAPWSSDRSLRWQRPRFLTRLKKNRTLGI